MEELAAVEEKGGAVAKVVPISRKATSFFVSVRHDCANRAEGAQYDAVEDANFATQEAADVWCSALNSHVGFVRYEVVEKLI